MTTLNLQVAASGDDAYQFDGDTADPTAAVSALGTGNTASHPHRATGLRFRNVTIAPGSTINSAVLKLRKHNTDWNNVALTWYGNDADNAAAFSGGEDLTARTYTTASVACSENISRTGGTFYAFPSAGDWKAIVQEIIDRAGWSSGNALVIIADGNSATNYASVDVDQYDEAAAGGATLDIDYTAPAAGGAALVTRKALLGVGL